MFAKDGTSVILTAIAISAILAAVGYFLLKTHWSVWIFYLGALSTTVFTLYFFRDPDRTTPDEPMALISPADGKVVLIKEVDETKYLNGKGTQISIFLSPLDVHVNRIPLSGVIEHADYIPGDYLVAWHPKSSELNERSEFGLAHESGTRIFFKQITGYVARRIVYHIGEGDTVKAGDRFGMMKFGSRMDIVVGDDVEILSKEGDVVRAGETIMGRIKTSGDQ